MAIKTVVLLALVALGSVQVCVAAPHSNLFLFSLSD
jgi:hypothetical protein